VRFTPVPKATEVKFELRVNGLEAPDKIHVGAEGAHPEKAEFTLPAAPREVPDAGKNMKK
jgi:hypothetical protein